MKFCLTQSTYSPELEPLLKREIERHHPDITDLTKEEIKEVAALSKVIEKGKLPDYLVRKKIDDKLGYGIFLHPNAEALQKGHVIAPYSGIISCEPQNAPDESVYAFGLIYDILLDKAEQQRWDPTNRFHPRRRYCFKLDAWKQGSFTRFINHSEKPNLISYMVSIPKNRYGVKPALIEVVYFVKKMVRPGEQLLVSYDVGESNFWKGGMGKAAPMLPRTYRLDQNLHVIKAS